MRTKRMLVATACVALLLLPGLAIARSSRHRHANAWSAPPTSPSQDAIELATLAPPSRLSTIEQTYGDATYARHRLVRRIDGEKRADAQDIARFGGMPYPCDPRAANASAYACNGAPHTRSYGQGYAFTPDYLSAPQRLGVPADEQTQMLSPLTGLAWVVNSLRYDAHN